MSTISTSYGTPTKNWYQTIRDKDPTYKIRIAVCAIFTALLFIAMVAIGISSIENSAFYAALVGTMGGGIGFSGFLLYLARPTFSEVTHL